MYTTSSEPFSGIQKDFDNSNYVVLGVPFDVTSTYRTGARFGPTAIREASMNIETYSLRSGIDISDLKIHDLGNLHVLTRTEKTLDRLKAVVEEIHRDGKIPVAIGGEHTITLGILRGLSDKCTRTAVVSLDAHLDLRDEFSGLRVSHTTFMRRVKEELDPARIVEIGTRAVCREEVDYSEETGIMMLTTDEIKRRGLEDVADCLKKELSHHEIIYLTVDMDVLDPAYAPAVQNPEPGGLSTTELLTILYEVCDTRIAGLDVVEVAPNFDSGISAIHAAKIVFEILCYLEKSKLTGAS